MAPSLRELSAMLTEGVVTCGQDISAKRKENDKHTWFVIPNAVRNLLRSFAYAQDDRLFVEFFN